jgi:uncharacterized membrane protein YfcA
MDLRFTGEEQAFRAEVRAFIAEQLPQATRERMTAGLSPTKEMVVDWQRRLNARGWAVPLGLVGGVMSALFGTGGSFYLIYIAGRVEDKSALRATISTVLGTSNAVRLMVFFAAGLLAPGVLITALVLSPVVFCGLWVGGRLHAKVTRAQILRGVCILLVVSGASLLWRALHAL